MKTIQQDLKSNNLFLNEAIDVAQKSESPTLETDFYVIVLGLRGVLCAIICPLILTLDPCRGHVGD